jgi:DNA-damage-inducible protein D
MSTEPKPEAARSMIVFGAKQIRRAWVDDQWYFSVVDIVAALTDSENPRNYWNMMKARELKESEVQLSTFCVQLKLPSSDGKSYKTDCVNTEAAFRIIQSIPSPKAEPFKRWLAQVGYERVHEIENPELAQQRMHELYRQKGYPAGWIEKRVRSIAVRDELTGEWTNRGVQEQRVRHPHGRNIQGHLRSNARRVQEPEGPQARKPARPHDRSGIDFHHARRSRQH